MIDTDIPTAPLPVMPAPTRRLPGLPLIFCDPAALAPGTAVAVALEGSLLKPVPTSGTGADASLLQLTGRTTLQALEDYAAGRRFVWASAHAPALIVTANFLALPLEPLTGLTPELVAAATGWVRTRAYAVLVDAGSAIDPTRER